MKIQLLIFGLILFFNSCSSKSEYVPNKRLKIINESNESNKVEIELCNNQLKDKIWLGVPTPYEIKNTKNQEYFIKEKNTEFIEIIRKGKNDYSISIKKRGTVGIEILNKQNEIISVKKLKTKYLPNLIPYYCGIRIGGKIGKKQLLNCIEKKEKIRVTSENYDINATYKVKTFELVIFDKKGKSKIIKSESEYINSKQEKFLLKLEQGDRFYLEKIIVDRLDKNEEILSIMGFEMK